MEGYKFITFPFGNKILITWSYGNKAIVSLNTETKVVEETDLELQEGDDFSYFNNGMRVNDSIYLVGNKHIHIVDLAYIQIKIIRDKGIHYE